MSIELFDAIEEHDTKRIKDLLLRGVDANAINEKGWTALQIAIDETYDGGEASVVKLLLDHGATTNLVSGARASGARGVAP